MIIECGQCGAPLDVKTGIATTKCVYCGTSSHVKSLRTVAFETPPGWRPPQQWIPPAHVAANSAIALNYSAAAKTASKAIIMVALIVPLVIVIGVAGTIFAVASSGQSAVDQATNSVLSQYSDNGKTGSITNQLAGANVEIARALELARQAEGLGNQAKAAAVDSPLTSSGIAQALEAYKAQVGGSKLSLLKLTAHEGHSSIEAISPKNEKHLDSYNYRNGAVTGPDPVRVSGSQKGNLKAAAFDPEATALLKLDELKKTAIKEFKYEDPKITHVIMRASRGKVELYIYGSDERDSGYVRFDAAGKVTRVAR